MSVDPRARREAEKASSQAMRALTEIRVLEKHLKRLQESYEALAVTPCPCEGHGSEREDESG